MRAALLALCLLFLFPVSRVSSASSLSAAELIQSVPDETGLAQPDLAYAQDAWIDMFRHARKTIDIAEFYLASNPGGPLEPVLRELAQAASRGVKIRVLVCPNLVHEDQATFDRIRAIPNTELRLLDLSRSTHGILHAKYFVVDAGAEHPEIFVGSQNFDWRALIHIHELGVRVRDAGIASKLESIFESDWRFARSGQLPRAQAQSPSPSKGKSPDIELVASPPLLNPPGIRPSIQALTELIDSARHSLRIQVMSYELEDKYGGKHSGAQPKWTEIDDALRRAAGRGVSVRMMVADWSVGHPAIDELKALERFHAKRPIRIRIVSIPEARSGHIPYARVVHSKYMIVDGRVLWVGTSNWEKNYFYASRNVGLIFHSSQLSKECKKVFARLWKSRFSFPLELKKEYVRRKAA